MEEPSTSPDRSPPHLLWRTAAWAAAAAAAPAPPPTRKYQHRHHHRPLGPLLLVPHQPQKNGPKAPAAGLESSVALCLCYFPGGCNIKVGRRRYYNGECKELWKILVSSALKSKADAACVLVLPSSSSELFPCRCVCVKRMFASKGTRWVWLGRGPASLAPRAELRCARRPRSLWKVSKFSRVW